MWPPVKHLFLINPRAGKRDRSGELLEQIRRAAEGRGLDWRAEITRAPGHAVQLAGQAAGTGEAVRLYACGGDGTLNETAAGAAGHPNAAVTHIPTGSGNDFLRMFGPHAGRFRDVEQLLGPVEQGALDLIECNGRLALNVCSVGFDARIGLGAADFKRLPLVGGSMAYQLSALRTIIRGIHRPYRVEVDGQTLSWSAYTLMCACNGRYYGGGFHPCPSAQPDDGLLDFVIIPAVSRLTILALIGKYREGGAGKIPQILLRRGREMKIRCDRVSMVNLDGERMDTDELSIRLSAKKVNFFFPQGAHWNPSRRGENEIIKENRRKQEIEAY